MNQFLGSVSEEYVKQKELITNRSREYCDDYISIKGYEFAKEKDEFLKQIS